MEKRRENREISFIKKYKVQNKIIIQIFHL